MNKILVVSVMFFFINATASFASEKPCSEYNKFTQYKLYKKCMDEIKGNKNKSGNLLSDINKKYKDIRKKVAPKTGEEYWKDIKKKSNEN